MKSARIRPMPSSLDNQILLRKSTFEIGSDERLELFGTLIISCRLL